MGLPGGMPLLDEWGNFNVMRLVDLGQGGYQVQRCTSYGSVANLRAYNARYSHPDVPHLLDELRINAVSPEALFSLMLTGIPPTLDQFSVEELQVLLDGKHEFFAGLRGESIRLPQTVRLTTDDAGGTHTFSFADMTGVFNPGALALLSLPAYLVLDVEGILTSQAPGQPKPTPIRGSFVQLAPRKPDFDGDGMVMHEGPVSIRTLDDYTDAFHYGNFLANNSDFFLTVYGVAHCLAAFVQQCRDLRLNRRVSSIDEVLTHSPFLYVYKRLASIGALHDPFDRTDIMWRFERDGIANAREVSPRLHATLRLAEELAPLPMVTVAPGAVSSIFYGLIQVFCMYEYFGLAMWTRMEFPR